MGSTIKTTKITFKKTEREWFNYHQTLREIARVREEIETPFREEDENIGGERVPSNSSPTENISVRMTTSKQLNYLIEIVRAIEQVYNALPEDYKKLVHVRYWSKRDHLTWDKIAMECNVSKWQAMRWRDEIVQATVEVLGWR